MFLKLEIYFCKQGKVLKFSKAFIPKNLKICITSIHLNTNPLKIVLVMFFNSFTQLLLFALQKVLA